MSTHFRWVLIIYCLLVPPFFLLTPQTLLPIFLMAIPSLDESLRVICFLWPLIYWQGKDMTKLKPWMSKEIWYRDPVSNSAQEAAKELCDVQVISWISKSQMSKILWSKWRMDRIIKSLDATAKADLRRRFRQKETFWQMVFKLMITTQQQISFVVCLLDVSDG